MDERRDRRNTRRKKAMQKMKGTNKLRKEGKKERHNARIKEEKRK
jgi:hypothetical protein